MTIVVNAITPNRLPTGGRRLVRIAGSGFRLPPPPPTRGPAPKPSPSMRVLFDGWEAPETRVLSNGTLHVIAPPNDVGPADVTILSLIHI